jgi:hypothetical protein
MTWMLLLTLACATPASKPPVEAPCTACEGACTADTVAVTSAQHTSADLDYELSPPAGGDHDPCWAPWGVHTDEVRPENWLHNAEHGGVIVLHGPDAAAADVAALHAWVAAQPPGRALSTPYAGPMDRPYAAVMWGARLQLDCVDTAALDAFFAANVGGAPEDTIADPPSSCWDGDSGGDTATTSDAR